MSHEVTVKCALRDILAVRAACERLGWDLRQGGTVRYYSGAGQACDFTIELTSEASLHGRYNLGLQYDAAQGCYQILVDNAMNFSRTLPTDQLGGETPRVIGALQQHYNLQVFAAYAQANGLEYQVTEENGQPVALLQHY